MKPARVWHPEAIWLALWPRSLLPLVFLLVFSLVAAGWLILLPRAASAVDEAAPAAVAPAPPAATLEQARQGRTALARGAREFAFNLYGRLRGGEGNVFFSPYSVWTALAMTSAGARGETARQMTAVLGLPDAPFWTPAQLHEECWVTGKVMNAVGARADGVYEAAVANRLWGAKGYAFRPEFLGLLETAYGAGTEEADFAGDLDGARRAINAWAGRETRGRIADLVGPDALRADARLVLASTIWFRGPWARPFDPADTGPGPFYVAAGREVRVPFMWQTFEECQYAEVGDVRLVELPYKGWVRMVVLLPKAADGLAALEQGLSEERVREYLKALRSREVRVGLPKFRLESSLRLASTLAGMGMPLAFDAEQADLGGIAGGAEPLFIADVIHRAWIDTNETGTEAAAATAVEARPAEDVAPPLLLRADHPFVFLIHHVCTNQILFLGRVADPSGEAGPAMKASEP